MSSAMTHMALSTMLASSRRPCPVRATSASAARMPTVAMSPASGHRDGRRRRGRRSVGEAAEQTGVAEVGQVVAGRVGVRAGVAEARHRAPDQAGVLLAHDLVAEPEPVELARSVRLDDDVGPPHQPAQHRLGRPCDRRSSGERSLPAVEGHVRRVEPPGRRERPHAVAGAGRLDLDDVGALVGEHQRAEGPGEHPGQVEDLHGGEGSGGGRSWVVQAPRRRRGRSVVGTVAKADCSTADEAGAQVLDLTVGRPRGGVEHGVERDAVDEGDEVPRRLEGDRRERCRPGGRAGSPSQWSRIRRSNWRSSSSNRAAVRTDSEKRHTSIVCVVGGQDRGEELDRMRVARPWRGPVRASRPAAWSSAAPIRSRRSAKWCDSSPVVAPTRRATVRSERRSMPPSATTS